MRSYRYLRDGEYCCHGNAHASLRGPQTEPATDNTPVFPTTLVEEVGYQQFELHKSFEKRRPVMFIVNVVFCSV